MRPGRAGITGKFVPVSPLSTLAGNDVVFLDVETTGSSPRLGERITEIAIVRFRNGVLSDSFSQLVDPQRRLPRMITQLTGITPAMLEGQPRFSQIVPSVTAMLQNAIVIGHNVRFDLGFLHAEFSRDGADLGRLLSGGFVLDTVRLARRLVQPRGNALGRLAARLGVEVGIAHRAMADCLTTAAVFETMLAPHGGWRLPVHAAIELQGGPIRIAGAPAAEPGDRVSVADALQEAAVHLTYLDAANNRSRRVVRPVECRPINGEQTLLAYCLLRNDRRMFKLSRIIEIRRLRLPAPPAEPDPEPSPEASGSFLEWQ